MCSLKVAQLCLTFCDPMVCNLPGLSCSSHHGFSFFALLTYNALPWFQSLHAYSSLCQDYPCSWLGWFLPILYSQGLCLRLLISDIIHSFHKTVFLKGQNQRCNLLCHPTLAMLLTVTDTGAAKLLKHRFS